jgi:hypothetical protein
MKYVVATTLLCANLALAIPAPVTGPAVPETVPAFRDALVARAAEALPQLEERATKPKGSSGGGSANSSAAVSVTPSSALIVGALGLGVMEVVRLWN